MAILSKSDGYFFLMVASSIAGALGGGFVSGAVWTSSFLWNWIGPYITDEIHFWFTFVVAGVGAFMGAFIGGVPIIILEVRRNRIKRSHADAVYHDESNDP